VVTVEFLVLGMIAVVLLAVFGALWSLAAMVCWLVFLPFRLLAFVFKGLTLLLVLPVLLIAGLIAAAAIGLPLLLVLFVTAGPFVLLFLLIAWLAKRGTHHAAPAR
jgi:hypothetical protein